MAYKNVGTPVFYVDLLGWLKSHGLLKLLEGNVYVSPSAMDLIGIDPSSTKKLTPLALGGAPGSSSWGGNTDIIKYQLQGIDQTFNQLMPDKKNFSMILGHNLQTATAEFLIQAGGNTSGGTHSVVARGSYVNFPSTPDESSVPYDGFSIARANDAHEIDIDKIQFRFDSVPEGDGYTTPSINIGSLAYGTYYEMPHSPELKLTMTREMDGIKRTRTKGGSDLTNHKYTTQPTWDGEAAWELWLGMPTLIQDPDGDDGEIETGVSGCTDPDACNYDGTATEDDSSCEYGFECWDGSLDCDGVDFCPEEEEEIVWIYGCMDDGWCVDHEPTEEELSTSPNLHYCSDEHGEAYNTPGQWQSFGACNFDASANAHNFQCNYMIQCEATGDLDETIYGCCEADAADCINSLTMDTPDDYICPPVTIDPGNYGDNNWHWILEIWDWMFPENEDLESDEAYLFSCNPADWTAQNKVFPTDPTSQVKDYSLQVGETVPGWAESGWSNIAGSFKWIFTYGEMCPNQFGISITEDNRWDPFDCGPNYAAAQQFALDGMAEYGDILTGATVLQEGGEWVENISWDDWNDFEFVDNYCQLIADNGNCVPGTAVQWNDTWTCDEVDSYFGYSPNANIVHNYDEFFMIYWHEMLQNFELCPHVYGRCSNPNVYNMQGRSSRSGRSESTSNPALARAGRRVWDLSFSYLDSTDSLGVNQSWNNLYDVESTGYSTDDLTLQEDAFNVNLLTDDSFFAQVIHKTNGGQLPFVFQPDSNNKNPDQFAICKLDMKSFQFKQVSNGIYDIKLKIREVW